MTCPKWCESDINRSNAMLDSLESVLGLTPGQELEYYIYSALLSNQVDMEVNGHVGDGYILDGNVLEVLWL